MKAFFASLALFALACTSATAPPTFPVTIRLRLVNQTSDSVYVMMQGEESASPGIRRVEPADSACTDLYASADSVPVEVHSLTTNGVLGRTWLYPLRATGWRVLVNELGATGAVSKAC